MGKTLVIVESPAKCKKIESYLGDGYRCIASYGHIQGLDNSRGLRCIDVENQFTPVYVHLPEKQQQQLSMRVEACRAAPVASTLSLEPSSNKSSRLPINQ